MSKMDPTLHKFNVIATNCKFRKITVFIERGAQMIHFDFEALNTMSNSAEYFLQIESIRLMACRVGARRAKSSA